MRSLLAALALCAAAAAPAEDAFPDFSGQTRLLADLVGGGRWVVVMLWASDCHICNEEVPGLVAFHERHREKDARMLGIALDGAAGKADAQAFVDRHGVTFDNLLAGIDDAAAMYTRLTGRRWVGTPTFLVYGPHGRLLAQQVGALEIEVIEDFINRHGDAGG